MVVRRMLLIVAVLMGITALTAGLSAPPRSRAPAPDPAAQQRSAADPVLGTDPEFTVGGGRIYQHDVHRLG